MSDSGTIPDLIYTNSDGRPRSRLEMDLWIRENCKKVHWLRIIAIRIYGLSKQYAFDMKEIVLRHWLLDEMVRRNQIYGNLAEINPQTHSNEEEVRQFTQRLAALIQDKQAESPKSEEGIDMNQFTPPPPPIMGTQTQVGPSVPQAPPAPPAFGYAPPMPVGAPPMAPPQAEFNPQGQAPTVPTVTAATAPGRGRRQRGAVVEAPQGAPPAVPGMTSSNVPAGFSPAPFLPSAVPVANPQIVTQMPTPATVGMVVPLPVGGASGGFMSMGATTPTPTPVPNTEVDLSPLKDSLDKILELVTFLQKQNAILQRKLEIHSIAITALSRVAYNKAGTADIEPWLQELGLNLPPL